MDYSPEEEKMTPAQIAEAQRLAREWMEERWEGIGGKNGIGTQNKITSTDN